MDELMDGWTYSPSLFDDDFLKHYKVGRKCSLK